MFDKDFLIQLGITYLLDILRKKARKQLAASKGVMLKLFKYSGEAYKDDADFKAAAAKIAGCETES